MDTEQTESLLALANCPVFGARTLEKLAAHFRDYTLALNADDKELKELGVNEKRRELFLAYRKGLDVKALADLVRNKGVTLITKEHETYPPLLKTIFDPPFVLFCRGDLSILNRSAVAIVGSRGATSYGLSVARKFGKEIAAQGVNVVSGLAHGIDSAAHEGALESGNTVAVLGHGILFHAPRETRELMEEIVRKGGLVISEFPVQLPGYPHHFPMRNRIIAGMSNASVIIEAKLPSGSLITAKCALDEGRDVFAVPGPIDSPTSAGTNALIKDGAHVATSAADILSLLGVEKPSVVMKVYEGENELERALISALQTEARLSDELVETLGIAPVIVAQTLMALELKGAVRNMGGMRYEIVSS